MSQQQRLFPKKHLCRRFIEPFDRQLEFDSTMLANIWHKMTHEQYSRTLRGIQEDFSRLLRHWQAYRNQSGQRNDRFLKQLAADTSAKNALFRIVTVTQRKADLMSIMKQKDSIETVYNFLRRSMFRDRPARILTVSKALLMIAGFTPAFDSKVLKAVRKCNRDLPLCPGSWPFGLFDETLRFLACEQRLWEAINGPMSKLIQDSGLILIGQIMDRILRGLGSEIRSTR